MPERCASRCSTVTSSAISGRSPPSTERAVVESSSEPVLDEAHHGERRQPLRAARDREPRVDRVRDPVAAVGEPVGLRELDVAAAVDAHDTGEARLGSERVELSFDRRRHAARRGQTAALAALTNRSSGTSSNSPTSRASSRNV